MTILTSKRRATTLSLLLLAATAQAGDALRSAGPALEEGQSHSGPRLTGAALRTCVRIDHDLDAVETELRILQGPVDAAAWGLELKGDRLDALKAGLDHSDGGAVDRYNALIDEHARAVDEYNALLPEFNEVASRQRALVERFNDECAERAYLKKAWWDEEARLRQASS